MIFQPHEVPEAYKKRHNSEETTKESGEGKKVETPHSDSDEDMPLSHVKQKKVYKLVALRQLVSVLLSFFSYCPYFSVLIF